MPTDDNTAILTAIKESSNRTENVIGELSNEIRTMAGAITKGFAHLQSGSTLGRTVNGNAGLYGVIATFSVVILSLATLFMGALNSHGVMLTVVQSHLQEKIADLDDKLQKEILALHKETAAKFSEVDSNSEHRHDAQQSEIIEIKGWFKAPALRNNGDDFK